MILKKATRTTMAMLVPESKDLEAIQQVAVNLLFTPDFPDGIASTARGNLCGRPKPAIDDHQKTDQRKRAAGH